MLVDSHCHLEMESFDGDRDAVIDRSVKEGVSHILTVGTEEKYFNKVMELIEGYAFIYGAMGIHPHNSTNYNKRVAKILEKYMTHDKIVACGEIGLDFFKDYSPREIQKKVFREQLELADSARLPVIIHSRNAKEETLKILRDSFRNTAGGVIHCYSYDIEGAKKFLDLGFYVSIPGTITFSKDLNFTEVVRYIPEDRLLAETDAPFLAPYPRRGRRNEPSYVKHTINKLAEIRKVSMENLATAILRNFTTLFLRGKTGGSS